MTKTKSHLPWADPRPRASRQLSLLFHLVLMSWRLARRIPWADLGPGDRARLQALPPMLERMAARARLAGSRRRKGAA
jgi:hypothetical protein